jgi:hypothetical protein
MDVIFSAIHDQRGSLHFSDNPTQIGEQVRFETRRDKRLPIFCAEDQVDDDISKCVRQFFRPSGLACATSLPTACAVGCILAPLSG